MLPSITICWLNVGVMYWLCASLYSYFALLYVFNSTIINYLIYNNWMCFMCPLIGICDAFVICNIVIIKSVVEFGTISWCLPQRVQLMDSIRVNVVRMAFISIQILWVIVRRFWQLFMALKDCRRHFTATHPTHCDAKLIPRFQFSILPIIVAVMQLTITRF